MIQSVVKTVIERISPCVAAHKKVLKILDEKQKKKVIVFSECIAS